MVTPTTTSISDSIAYVYKMCPIMFSPDMNSKLTIAASVVETITSIAEHGDNMLTEFELNFLKETVVAAGDVITEHYYGGGY